ncbi:MAG TPA: hypothetical protein VEJ44_00395, partial [Acidimicrobiales bacterium]|nr:hypothetical protein [Acidimicrobiales bacterium]
MTVPPSGLVTTPSVPSEATDPSTPRGHPRAGRSDAATSRGRARPVAQVLRVAGHAVIWATVLVPAVIEMAEGWRPTRDDAMITIGAAQVFSAKFPLVGVWSLASQGTHHAFFDPGPLLFWLLAVPVRLDPAQGAVWGSALVCGAALSLAAEALWSVVGWPGPVAVELVVADLSWQTHIFSHVDWNPYFGLVFLVATVAVGWAVAVGRFGWWPVTVFLASVSAQCHLVDTLTAVALVGAVPCVAYALGYRPRRWRWLIGGVAVAVLGWAAPLVQQWTTHPGNLSLILSSPGSRRVGLGFGLHAMATAAAPDPIWLTKYPFLTTLVTGMPAYLEHHGTAWGVVVLALLAAVAVTAGRTRRRRLAATAALAFLISLATVVTFAAFPSHNLVVPLAYLCAVLWAVGIVVWVTVLWAAA